MLYMFHCFNSLFWTGVMPRPFFKGNKLNNTSKNIITWVTFGVVIIGIYFLAFKPVIETKIHVENLKKDFTNIRTDLKEFRSEFRTTKNQLSSQMRNLEFSIRMLNQNISLAVKNKCSPSDYECWGRKQEYAKGEG